MELKDQLYVMNPHWEGERYQYKFYRDIFGKLVSQLDKNLILSLIGPRRVGKTVLMKQLIQYLLSDEAASTEKIYNKSERNKIDKKRILYFSFDEYRADPFAVIKLWKEEFALDLRKGNYWLFFDEIQYINNWAEKIKIIYDSYPNFKLVISGSASAKLKRGKESLAGRELQFIISPLSFNEYLRINNKEVLSEEIKMNFYLDYLKRQLPALVASDLDSKEYIKEIVDKTIDYDIPFLFNIEDIDKLRSIFRLICKSPGDIIRIEDLSSELGMNRITLSKYLEALEESFLVRKLYNYSRNPRKSEKRAKKFYPYFTTLHEYTFPFTPDFSRIAETEVAFQTNAQYFWNERGHEIDFIIGGELDIGIEVKIRKKLKNSDFKWLLNAPFSLSHKLVVTLPDLIHEKYEGIEFVNLPDLTSYLSSI
jgi:predicted AAA+ superfamily ATPase